MSRSTYEPGRFHVRDSLAVPVAAVRDVLPVDPPVGYWTRLSRQTGIPQRSIYAYRTGRRKYVTLDHAEAVLEALGLMLPSEVPILRISSWRPVEEPPIATRITDLLSERPRTLVELTEILPWSEHHVAHTLADMRRTGDIIRLWDRSRHPAVWHLPGDDARARSRATASNL